MLYLRQSTAATVELGPFVSITDAVTEKTALTSQTGLITKNGTGASLTPSSWAHDANGNYLVGLSTSHTDTVGRLRIAFQDSATYLPVWAEFHVLSAAVYDVLFGTVAPSTYAGADTSGTTTLLSRVGSALTISGGKVAATVASGDGADSASVKATIGTAGAGLTALGDTRLAHLDADVSSRLATSGYTAPLTASGVRSAVGLAGANLDTQLLAISDQTALIPASPASTSDVSAVPAAVWDLATSGHTTAGTFGAAMVGASAPSATTVAEAVWDLNTTGHTTSGTFGAAMNAAGSNGDPWATNLPGAYASGTAGYILGTNLDAAVSTRSTYAGADTSGTTTLLSRLTSTRAGYLDNLTNLDAQVSTRLASLGTNAPAGWINTAAFAAGATLPRVTLVDTCTTNTDMRGTDNALLASGYTAPLDAAGVRTAVGLASANLDAKFTPLATSSGLTILQAHGDSFWYGSDISGLATGANLSALQTTATAIKAKTDNLPNSPAAVGSTMTVDLTKTLSAARDLSAVADTSLTLNDAFHAAVAGAAGKESVVDTTYTVKTSAGTTLRTFTLDDASAPTSRT